MSTRNHCHHNETWRYMLFTRNRHVAEYFAGAIHKNKGTVTRLSHVMFLLPCSRDLYTLPRSILCVVKVTNANS